jgi:hypothetical protein
MPVQTKRHTLLGFAAAALSIFARRRKPTTQDLKDADFKTSTQRSGIRFTERVRDVFRFRWIRKI